MSTLLSLPLLSVLLWLPLVGALMVALMPSRELGYRVGMLMSMIILLVTGGVCMRFDSVYDTFQLRESVFWIQSLGISYELGLDGLSLIMVLITAVLFFAVIAHSYSLGGSDLLSNKRYPAQGYVANLLLLEGATLGSVLSLDLVLFYLFWELTLLPCFILTGRYGTREGKGAALRFVLYTLAGSICLLGAFLYLVWAHYERTPSHEVTFLIHNLTTTALSTRESSWLFFLTVIGFGVKIPLFPLHAWLPRTYAEAPAGGAALFSGVLSKLGLYGVVRFAFPLFGSGAFASIDLFAAVAVAASLYAACLAWVEKDMRKVLAYSSFSHVSMMAFGVFAFTPTSLSGVFIQMVGHAGASGALFLLVGTLIARHGSAEVGSLRGLARSLPSAAFLFMLCMLSSIGLPLTVGFVGEFLVLVGSFGQYPLLASIATLTVILSAVYFLSFARVLIWGDPSHEKAERFFLTRRDIVVLGPLAALLFVLGVFPQPLLTSVESTVRGLVEKNIGAVRPSGNGIVETALHITLSPEKSQHSLRNSQQSSENPEHAGHL